MRSVQLSDKCASMLNITLHGGSTIVMSVSVKRISKW